MPATSPESLALLSRAAELRASGVAWADAATQLAVIPDELRRLASEHGRDYERLLRRARAEVLRESLDEALATLRGFLKSPEPRVGMSAALTIERYEVTRMRLGGREAGARPERGAREPRDKYASESPEVKKEQEVNATENVAQPGAPKPPASVSPPPSRPAPTTARPAAPPAGESRAALADLTHRSQRQSVT